MSRYFIELAYDGSNYHGWQIQPNASSVQETLEKAISTLLKQDISVVGCGRTDTGVHASFFVAHFEYEGEMREDLVYKHNSILSADIVLFSIYKVGIDMHARFSAKSRTYRYHISLSKPVFRRPYSYYYYGELDIAKMNRAASVLLEYEDFTSFAKLHADTKTNNCRLMRAEWIEAEDGLEFWIQADRFLRNMVRSIVGTMLEVGKGKMSIDEFREVIEAKDRSKAGSSAEARGLFLAGVAYS